MNARFGIVFMTCATKQQAQALAESILRERLAACVQIECIESRYWWDGALCRDDEWRLTAKTRVDRFAALQRHVCAHHEYDTPQVLLVPVEAGSEAYLAWIDREVGRDQRPFPIKDLTQGQ